MGEGSFEGAQEYTCYIPCSLFSLTLKHPDLTTKNLKRLF